MRTCKFFLILTGLLYFTNSFGQETGTETKKFEALVDNPAGSKIVLVNLAGDISITGNNTNKIIIEATGIKPLPKRADGLKRIGSGGEDNTGLGLNYEKTENRYEFYGTVSANSGISYKLSIPKNLKSQLELNVFHSSKVEIESLASDIELNVKTSQIKIKDVTGPLVISSLSGNIEVLISSLSQSGPFSIKSISGEIDLSIPEKSNADLELASISGEIYSDLDIKPAGDKSKSLPYIGGSSNIKAKLNSGGVKFMVSSVSGNIYMRKKK